MSTTDLSGPSLKTNLHTHTSYSDGAFDLAAVVAAYEDLDYDVLAITDHNQWRDHQTASTARLLVLSGNEPSLSNREHLLAIGVAAASPVDTGDRSSVRTQEVIDWIVARGGFALLNHPVWSGMPVARSQALQRYHAVEIFNGGCTGHGSELSLTHWDELLRCGRRVWGVATDDSHADWDRGRGWIELFCERTEAALLDALLSGRFYATTGPKFEQIRFVDGQLTIRCEPVLGIAVLSGVGPVHVVHGGSGAVTSLDWAPPAGVWDYLRVELHRADGAKAWSNPVFPGP